MPYVERNESGAVVAIASTQDTGGGTKEFLPLEHAEVLAFLAALSSAKDGGGASLSMMASDLRMIRVIEDVVDLLIQKNVIIFSDLPQAVQSKLLQKRGQRERLFGKGGDIIGSSEGIL